MGQQEQKKEINGSKKDSKGCSPEKMVQGEVGRCPIGEALRQTTGRKARYAFCRPSKRVSKKTPVTAKELTPAQKRSRVAQKKKLGQPAGKPRRVKSVRKNK